MLFSERMGYKKVKDIIQIDKIDEDLRNALWNSYYLMIGQHLYGSDDPMDSKNPSLYIFEGTWVSHWNKRYDEMPYHQYERLACLKQYFFTCEWYDLYDILEFTVKKTSNEKIREFLPQRCNEKFEHHLSGYRFVNNEIAPITSEEQISEVQKALDFASQPKMHGIYTHLESALQKLSHKTDPDYRNSIKESISAVESLVQTITNDPKAELGKGLKIIKDKIGLHGALEKGFSNLYGYTSDGDGIRHALLEKSNLDQEDAIYMLVSCSAFINYLVVKATKAGIDI